MDSPSTKDRKLNKTEWALMRQRAIASKDPVCAICHMPIDITLPMKDPETGLWNPLAVEVDHIVPRVRGGPMYEMDNLQLTHNRCNRKKGSKMDSDYEGLKVANQFPHSNNW